MVKEAKALEIANTLFRGTKTKVTYKGTNIDILVSKKAKSSIQVTSKDAKVDITEFKKNKPKATKKIAKAAISKKK